jgi:hypothetical protein
VQRDLYTFLPDYMRNMHAYTRVIFFVLEEDQPYPLLFVARCLQRLGADTPVVRLDLELLEEKDIYRELETSFLGQERVIWLSGLTALSERAATTWITYIQNYTGPHRIICAVASNRMPTTTLDQVAVTHMINKRECSALYAFLAQRPLHQVELERIQHIFTQHETIALDMACILFEYLSLVGRDAQEFMQDWLVRLMPAQSSLFALSQHLFARSLVPFMTHWAALKPLYSDQFWIAFWSEQFWRASWYIYYMRQKQSQQAKKIGFRLPFSFLQKDYRSYSIERLAGCVTQLYLVDTAIKHSRASDGIDLFLYRFFAR